MRRTAGRRCRGPHLAGGWDAQAPYCRQASQCTQTKTKAKSWMIWMWKREILATRGLLRRSCTAASTASALNLAAPPLNELASPGGLEATESFPL